VHSAWPRSTYPFVSKRNRGGRRAEGKAALRRASPAFWTELGLGNGRDRSGSTRRTTLYPQLHQRWPDVVVVNLSGGPQFGWPANSRNPAPNGSGKGSGRSTGAHWSRWWSWLGRWWTRTRRRKKGAGGGAPATARGQRPPASVPAARRSFGGGGVGWRARGGRGGP
jgi:hypothetical protein